MRIWVRRPKSHRAETLAPLFYDNMAARYFTVLAAGFASLLAGAAVTHELFRPELDLHPLDPETAARLEALKKREAAKKKAVLDAIDRGDTEEITRLLQQRFGASKGTQHR